MRTTPVKTIVGCDPMNPHPASIELDNDGHRTLLINTDAEIITAAARRARCGHVGDVSKAIGQTFERLLRGFVAECNPDQNTLDAACRLVLRTFEQAG